MTKQPAPREPASIRESGTESGPQNFEAEPNA